MTANLDVDGCTKTLNHQKYSENKKNYWKPKDY